MNIHDSVIKLKHQADTGSIVSGLSASHQRLGIKSKLSLSRQDILFILCHYADTYQAGPVFGRLLITFKSFTQSGRELL